MQRISSVHKTVRVTTVCAIAEVSVGSVANARPHGDAAIRRRQSRGQRDFADLDRAFSSAIERPSRDEARGRRPSGRRWPQGTRMGPVSRTNAHTRRSGRGASRTTVVGTSSHFRASRSYTTAPRALLAHPPGSPAVHEGAVEEDVRATGTLLRILANTRLAAFGSSSSRTTLAESGRRPFGHYSAHRRVNARGSARLSRILGSSLHAFHTRRSGRRAAPPAR